MHNMKELIESIKKNEGFVPTVYKCSEGFDTIGYGTRLPLTDFEYLDLADSRIFTGFGSGTDFPLFKSEAESLLKSRLSDITKEIVSQKPFVLKLPLFKQTIVYEMGYQLGVPKLMGFKKMFKALEGGYYALASKEMLNSKWAYQTPSRARELALKMATAVDNASFDVVN